MLSVAYVLFIVGCFVRCVLGAIRGFPSAPAALISNSGIGSTMDQVIYGRVVSGAGGAGMTALVSIVIAGMLLHMLTYLDLD